MSQSAAAVEPQAQSSAASKRGAPRRKGIGAKLQAEDGGEIKLKRLGAPSIRQHGGKVFFLLQLVFFRSSQI